MKRKSKSKTMWFNWVITTLVTTAGIAMVYVPDFGMSPKSTAVGMMVLTLVTTFGNKYLRTKTSEPLE